MECSGAFLPDWAGAVLADCAEEFARFDGAALANTRRVLDAFARRRVSDRHFQASTGYGYHDLGRDTLDALWADVFGAEDALVRTHFVSGTHAIGCALRAVCPQGGYLSLVGEPYDTLRGVMPYRSVPAREDGTPDAEGIERALRARAYPAVFIQRSRGYSARGTLDVAGIGELIRLAKSASPGISVVVDNCYGEFCETREPPAAGADLTAGSLIKNPGGSLAPCGGYIAGRAELVNRAAEALTVPGIGRECGAVPGGARLLYQGLFLAPHMTAQALKTAAFAARALSAMGYEVSPKPGEPRGDLIQSVVFGNAETMLRFVRGIQAASPVDSFVTPEPWAMPGYADKVVMAAGTFVQGSSIELSCDAPMREPYRAYLQGGVPFEAGLLGVMRAVEEVRT
ncbi:MAG: methionine gamma-lyase family protein [Oscillospiraceae bacterium]|nr:methionine gamma-lyase family protein [Oscillospiraceae bacterium]